MSELKKLPRIIRQCMTIGMIPSSYKLSLTYEEQLMWFCKFLEEEVIPVVNNNSQVTEELKNYFETLDVQEEINNKLDEMAESGELQEIITAYLQVSGLLAFNTLSELVAADNLIDGSFVKTYGLNSYNDGKGSIFKIRELINTDIVDGIKLIALTNYPTLVAERIQNADKINVVEYGVKNDGTDTTTTLQSLINLYGSATYYFPNGTYYFKDIELPSDTIIEGEGNTFFRINTNELHCNFKFENKENLTIKNCKFQNGNITGDGIIYGNIGVDMKACIYAINSENIKVENCSFDTIYWGILLHLCNNNYIDKCKFTNTGYNAIFVVGNSNNTSITNCLFDTAHPTNAINTYFVAFTETNYETGTGYPTNCVVDNCTFRNNPYWEALDTHGACKMIITNNKFYNCKDAIVLLNDQRFVNRHLHMKDILIDNNYIDMNNIEGGKALTIVGSVNGTQLDYFTCKNVTITNNIIANGGGANLPYEYLITLYYIENYILRNNVIECVRGGLRIHTSLFGDVTNNIFKCEPYAFYLSRSHVVTMKENKFITETIPNYIGNFEVSNVILKNNKGNYNTYLGSGIGYVSRFANYGEPILNLNTLAPTPNIVTSKYVTNVNSNDVLSSLKATTTANTNIVATDGEFMSDLSIWQNIVIAGAGVNGADLNCVITGYVDNKHFTINTEAGNSVTNANITLVHYTTTTY